MKIFLDTASIEEIETGVSWGIIDGVTTNPTLIAKESGNMGFDELVTKILKLVNGPVSLEVVALDHAHIVTEAKTLAKMGDNVVIKVPITAEGLKAIKILNKEGIHVNATLIFNSVQALLAAKAGATYVSPFVGRLDDIGVDGMAVVKDIKRSFENYKFSTKIIVASIRHPRHVYQASLIGADIVTMPFAILQKLIKHPKTDEGIDRFLQDWKKVNHTIL